MTCPSCGSTNVDRIGLYEYQCDDCGDVFDVTESEGDTSDSIEYGKDDDE